MELMDDLAGFNVRSWLLPTFQCCHEIESKYRERRATIDELVNVIRWIEAQVNVSRLWLPTYIDIISLRAKNMMPLRSNSTRYSKKLHWPHLSWTA